LLSGGEKQRLALARAFLFDFDILLLDEPTSNLDLELEKQVLNALFEKYKDKTIIVISHRPFVLDYVERVVVMSK
jgi:ABC-type transport system involved in cytochrome bd biosynthesis fused ATPase/permease subunit